MEPTHARVLVVEDEPAVGDVIERLLERAAYRVERAVDAATARACVEAGGIDLVLLDRRLPDTDGLTLCRALRDQESELYLPILLVTGLTSEAERNAGFAAGADDYVTKPFSPEDLLNRVGVWVRARQRMKAAHQRLLYQAVAASTAAVRDELSAIVVFLERLLAGWPADDAVPERAARVQAALTAATGQLVERIERLSQIEQAYQDLQERE